MAECLFTILPDDSHDIRIPSELGFEFIATPIQRLFQEHPATLTGILKVLCVLAIRFRRTYVHTPQMDWNTPFDTDMSFANSLLDSTSANDFARTLTRTDREAFANLSLRNIVAEDSLSREYLSRWEKLTFSVWECGSALPDRIEFIQECIKVRLPPYPIPSQPMLSNHQHSY